jgi:hypothetical protein
LRTPGKTVEDEQSDGAFDPLLTCMFMDERLSTALRDVIYVT